CEDDPGATLGPDDRLDPAGAGLGGGETERRSIGMHANGKLVMAGHGGNGGSGHDAESCGREMPKARAAVTDHRMWASAGSRPRNRAVYSTPVSGVSVDPANPPSGPRAMPSSPTPMFRSPSV